MRMDMEEEKVLMKKAAAAKMEPTIATRLHPNRVASALMMGPAQTARQTCGTQTDTNACRDKINLLYPIFSQG